MNNHHEESFTDRPGLRCRLVRRWESWRGPVDGHTALTTRHMETCEKCQAFFAEDFAFEEMLRTSARVEMRASVAPAALTLDGGFEQRILRAVRESRPEVERETAGRRSRAVSVTWTLAGAAAGVALAVLVAQRIAPEKQGPELVTVQKPDSTNGPQVVSREGADSREQAAEMPLRWWRSLDARESALELAAKNPLQEEIESISTDAQSVLGFLALNFLPVEAAAVKQPSGDSRVREAGQG